MQIKNGNSLNLKQIITNEKMKQDRYKSQVYPKKYANIFKKQKE